MNSELGGEKKDTSLLKADNVKGLPTTGFETSQTVKDVTCIQKQLNCSNSLAVTTEWNDIVV